MLPLTRPVLRTLTLRIDVLGGDGPVGVDLGLVRKLFPTVETIVEHGDEGVGRAARRADLEHGVWKRPDVDLWAFDRTLDVAVDAGRPLALLTPARGASRFALEVLTRSQRRIERRNAGSRAPHFDRVLEAHTAVHDRARAVAQADHDLALDRWQWTLRLEPSCTTEVQLAALLLGLASLEGGAIADRLLESADVDPAVRRSVRTVLAQVEARRGARDARTVADADALSFLSISSPGFVDFFGEGWARRRIASAVDTMGPAALAELPRIRLRRDVAAMVADAQAPRREACAAHRGK